jgi:hypothetical protein
MCSRPDDYCECVDCKKKREPTIQVGKTYINTDTGSHYLCQGFDTKGNPIFEVMRLKDGSTGNGDFYVGTVFSRPKNCLAEIKEYKEPRTFSSWCVLWDNNGKITMGGFVPEKDVKNYKIGAWHTGMKVLDHIEVHWREGTGQVLS